MKKYKGIVSEQEEEALLNTICEEEQPKNTIKKQATISFKMEPSKKNIKKKSEIVEEIEPEEPKKIIKKKPEIVVVVEAIEPEEPKKIIKKKNEPEPEEKEEEMEEDIIPEENMVVEQEFILDKCFASYFVDTIQERYDPNRIDNMDRTKKNEEELKDFEKDRLEIEWTKNQIKKFITQFARFLQDRRTNAEIPKQNLFVGIGEFFLGRIHPAIWEVVDFDYEYFDGVQMKCTVSNESIQKVYKVSIKKIDLRIENPGTPSSEKFMLSEYWIKFIQAWLSVTHINTLIYMDYEKYIENKKEQDYINNVMDIIEENKIIPDLLLLLQKSFKWIRSFMKEHVDEKIYLKDIDSHWFD